MSANSTKLFLIFVKKEKKLVQLILVLRLFQLIEDGGAPRLWFPSAFTLVLYGGWLAQLEAFQPHNVANMETRV